MNKVANTKTILVVEDEDLLLQSYSEILESVGYTTLKASDGYKGLDMLSANKDAVSLVLLDLMMPGMDGLEVLRQIRADKGKYGDVPVIVLTNMTSEKVIEEAFKIGAVSYLIKTELEYEDLVREVNRVLPDSE